MYLSIKSFLVRSSVMAAFAIAVMACQAKRLESQLVAAESATNKTLRVLVALKNALSDPSCTIGIGGRQYRRETVAEVLAMKLASCKIEVASNKQISEQLAMAKKRAQEVAAKVARWVEKEKALLAQVASLQEEQERIRTEKNVAELASASQDAVRLAVSVL